MQDEKFMPDLMPLDRLTALKEDATSIENTTYMRPLSEEEIAIRREDMTNNMINLSRINDEKKEIAKSFKERIAPLASANQKLMSEIKTRQETVSGTLYHIADHEKSMMKSYDGEGNLIHQRRLRPDEKQTSIYDINRASGEQ